MALITQKEYARRRKVSAPYINKLVRQGKIVLSRDGKIDPKKADAARKAYAQPARKRKAASAGKLKGGRPVGGRETATGSLTAKRAEREGYEAGLSRLKYERESGELLPRAQVLLAEQKKNANIRNRFRSLARRLAQVLAPEMTPAHVEAVLGEAIAHELTELARDPLGMLEVQSIAGTPGLTTETQRHGENQSEGAQA